MLALRHLATSLLLLAGLFATPGSARAAQGYDNCAGFIDTLPATIDTQGVWCLRHDLSTAITSGAAITINTDDVTIDCNDFKLGGLAGGIGTQAVGIYALFRQSATVRHCNVRGFFRGVSLEDARGHGHLVEDNRLDGNTSVGIGVQGRGSVVRRNQVSNTGGTTVFTGGPCGICTINSVDVLDNIVSGVLPGGSGGTAYGIYAFGNHDGSISNNRVRGVAHFGTGHPWGIYNGNNGSITPRLSVDGNHVIGDSYIASTGIRCDSDSQGFMHGVAIHNIINGFSDSGDCGGGFADNVFAP
jgi:hypothetical protein